MADLKWAMKFFWPCIRDLVIARRSWYFLALMFFFYFSLRSTAISVYVKLMILVFLLNQLPVSTLNFTSAATKHTKVKA